MKTQVDQRFTCVQRCAAAGLLIWLSAGSHPICAAAWTDPPVTIRLLFTAETNQVQLSWPTVPGVTYNVLATDALDRPWVSTNLPPVKATSTVGAVIDGVDTEQRFYRIREGSQPSGNNATISAATIAETEKVLGLTFTPGQRNQMLSILNGNFDSVNRRSYEAFRRHRLLNGDAPSLVFNPIPTGFHAEPTQEPIVWSVPTRLTAPTSAVDLAFASVRNLGEYIRTRQITSTDLTKLYLARLKRHDAALRCVITLTEDLALQQAARADAELAAGQYRGPLHGIPYGIKDLFAVKGYPTTWGAAPYQDQVFAEDAVVAKRLEEAGAVLLAKLSLGSLAQGDVWFRGQTRNPWDVGSGSGGSSAGPAAATAAGLVAFAIGSETWGSIVGPCTVCRVTGLRPTFGRVSRTGAMTLSWSMDKIGPICREVEDCALVFNAIRGADGLDQSLINAPFNYRANLDLRGLRVGYRGSYVSTTIRSRLATMVAQAHLVSVSLPDYPYGAMGGVLLPVEAAAAFDELTRFGGDAFLTSQGQYDWPNLSRAARTVPAVEYLQADRLRRTLIQEMAALMETVDLYVTTEKDDATLACANLTGQPCVVIPHGGMSLNFIGRLFDEATLLAVAKAYQDLTAYHTNRPPGFAR